MSPPPTGSLQLLSFFSPIFPRTAAADRVSMMKIWRSALQGNAKAKLFYPEQSEINPAEMEMRHNERMNSRSARGGRQKTEGEGGEGLGAVTNPKTCFNLLKQLCQQPGLDPTTPHASSVSQENVNKLAIADRSKPFQRAQNNKANLSVPGTILTRTVEREWHFRAGSLSIKPPHTSSKDTPEWNMGERDKWAFPLALPEGKLIYILCVILHRSHYHSFVTDAYLFYHRSENGNLHSLQGRGFNIVKSAQIVDNKKQWHIFSAFGLTTSSSFVPIAPLCLSVKRRGERHSDMPADTSKQRHGAVRYHLRVDATRSRVVKSIWPPSLRDYSAEQKKRKRRGREKVESGYRSNACSNNLAGRQARHTIKNNVA